MGAKYPLWTPEGDESVLLEAGLFPADTARLRRNEAMSEGIVAAGFIGVAGIFALGLTPLPPVDLWSSGMGLYVIAFAVIALLAALGLQRIHQSVRAARGSLIPDRYYFTDRRIALLDPSSRILEQVRRENMKAARLDDEGITIDCEPDQARGSHFDIPDWIYCPIAFDFLLTNYPELSVPNAHSEGVSHE